MLLTPGGGGGSSSDEEEEEEEAFPSLSVVDHYYVSWSVVLSSSDFSEVESEQSLAAPTLDNLFVDHERKYRFQVRLSCPSATRLVLGLIDDQGVRQRQPEQSSSAYEDPDKDAVACGPPIDMSRNVLECQGIPSAEALSRVNGRHYQSIFETQLEVTCLAYVDITGSTPALRQQRTRAATLGLVISTPEQSPVKATANLVLTESFHATRITNLTQYLQGIALDTATDSSGFMCQSNAAATPSDSEVCPAKEEDIAGLCSRQMACYYSAPSSYGSCSFSLGSMVMSSLPQRRSRRRTEQQQVKSLAENTITSRKLSAAQQPDRSLASSDGDNQWYRHETRYRVLWTVQNSGCSGFPILMEASCPNAGSIRYHPPRSSSSVTPPPSSSSKARSSDISVMLDETPGEESTSAAAAASAAIECHESLFADNTIHCRRRIPSAQQQDYQELVALDISCTQEFFQDRDSLLPNIVTVKVLETSNIQCHDWETTAVEANDVAEQEGGDRSSGFLRQPAVVESALTIVPVACPEEDAQSTSSSSNGTAQVVEHFVMFPPPIRAGSSWSAFDPSASVTCSACQDESIFFVNYHNSIGNKVSHGVKGCKTRGVCHDDVEESNGCINSIPASTISFEYDDRNAPFLSNIYPVESPSPSSLVSSQGQTSWNVAVLFTFICWFVTSLKL